MRYKLAFIFVSILFVGQAQLTSTHPLSSYGIGEYNTGTNAISGALGSVNTSMIDSALINFYNPSSYSRLSKGNTLLSLGIDSRLSWYSQDDLTEFNYATIVDHVALAFRMNKRMGMSFGLKPYSKMGYDFSQNVFTGVDSLRYTYTGKGSIQDVYCGFAISPINTPRTNLSIGANASYLFGYVSNERRSELITGSSDQGGLSKDITRLSAFHYQLGAHFEQAIGVKQKILVAFNMDPVQKFRGTFENELYTSSNINIPDFYDTITFRKTEGSVEALTSYEIGLKYELFFREIKRKSNTRRPKLSLFASYKKWAGMRGQFEVWPYDWEVGEANKWSLGLSFSPEIKLMENVATLKAMEKLNYRLGVFQTQTPFSQNGEVFIDRGTTFGIGIPILAQMSLSSLNFAFIIGQRGTQDDSILKENYLSFSFGMVFSPSTFEKWFRKRKLD